MCDSWGGLLVEIGNYAPTTWKDERNQDTQLLEEKINQNVFIDLAISIQNMI